jgi:hypothetical protein
LQYRHTKYSTDGDPVSSHSPIGADLVPIT